MRLFVAVPIPPNTSRELGEVVAQMRVWPGMEGLRWSPPESWHITLQFLGSATTRQYSCLVERLCQIRADPVEIIPEEIGTFRRVGIHYAGVKRYFQAGRSGKTRNCGNGAVWIYSSGTTVPATHHTGAKRQPVGKKGNYSWRGKERSIPHVSEIHVQRICPV